MKVLTHERSADQLQLFFVGAVLDISNAAFNLKEFLVRGLDLHPSCPAHRNVSVSFTPDGKHHICACPCGSIANQDHPARARAFSLPPLIKGSLPDADVAPFMRV